MAASLRWEEARECLKQLREGGERKSEEVVELWEDCLADFSYKVSDSELWLIQEQVCIAACDCGRTELAQECIDALDSQFPSSNRVKRLKGMKAESAGRYDHASQLYQTILEDDETNALVRKRQVAVLKEQNKIPEAIDHINKYLKHHMGDYEAWMELCDLYLQEHDYGKASFCMEELIMSNPHNHLYHQRYAEIKYSQGGLDNMETARAYFSHALKLNSNNMRALFGLFMSASHIASKHGSAKEKKSSTKYAAWAADQIARKYKMNRKPLQPIRALVIYFGLPIKAMSTLSEKQSDRVEAVEGMLDALQITPAS